MAHGIRVDRCWPGTTELWRETGIRIRDEGKVHRVDVELGGEGYLGIHRHVDGVRTSSGEPQRLGAGGESRALDHDHGAGGLDVLAGQRSRRDVVKLGREGIGGGEVLHRTLIEEGIGSATRAVDELVGEHEGARWVVSGDAPHRGGGDDDAHSETGERPDVRAIVDEVRGDRVVDAVAGEEGGAPSAEFAKSQLGRSVRCFDAALLAVRRVEQGVEAGAPDDGDCDSAAWCGTHPPILPAFPQHNSNRLGSCCDLARK